MAARKRKSARKSKKAGFFTRCVSKVHQRGVSLLRAEKICGAAKAKKRKRSRKAKRRRR